MTEIIKITLILPLFFLFIMCPLNIFKKRNGEISLDFLTYNLVINCNILLLFSFFPIPIKNYQIILIFSYLFFFIYLINKHKIQFISKNYLGFIFLYLFLIILSLVISNNLNLGWDAKYFYYTKSLFFVEGLGLSELSNFEHSKWHPHLGSYLWAFFWSMPFFELEYFGRLFYLFIFCYALYFISFSNEKNIFLKIAFFLFLLIFIFNYERFSGLQEILIYSFIIISSKILYDLNLKKKKLDIFMVLLISNIIIWTKSEGIVYACIIVLIMMLNKKIILKEKFLIFITLSIIILFKILVYNFYNFELNAQPYNLEKIFSMNLEQLFYRIKNIIIYLGYYSIKNIFFALGVVLLIILNLDKKNKILVNNFNLYFALNILFIFLAYLFRDSEIIYSLKTTMERVVFTSSSFYVYLIILYIINKIKVIK